jgi:hypothetical protein
LLAVSCRTIPLANDPTFLGDSAEHGVHMPTLALLDCRGIVSGPSKKRRRRRGKGLSVRVGTIGFIVVLWW